MHGGIIPDPFVLHPGNPTLPRPTKEAPTQGGDIVLDELRVETAALHDRLEKAVEVNRAMQVKVDTVGKGAIDQVSFKNWYGGIYRTYLCLSYLVERGFEQAIDESPGGGQMVLDLGIEPRKHRASALIISDLEHLGGFPVELIEIAQKPLLTSAESAAVAAGYEYVRTGSRLGGKVLAKIVRGNLGLDDSTGASFLNIGGKDVMPAFREFVQRLGPLSDSPTQISICTDSAKQAFKAIEHLAKGFPVSPSVWSPAPAPGPFSRLFARLV